MKGGGGIGSDECLRYIYIVHIHTVYLVHVVSSEQRPDITLDIFSDSPHYIIEGVELLCESQRVNKCN